MKLDLYSPEQARSALAGVWPKVISALSAGRRIQLEIRPASKTRDQECLYHAIIADVAKQAQHLGAKWDAETWKRLLLHRFAQETGRNAGRLIPTLDGSGVIELGVQSRKFSVKDATEFVDWLYAWAADHGIDLSE